MDGALEARESFGLSVLTRGRKNDVAREGIITRDMRERASLGGRLRGAMERA
mgnify:CR=1 FL=1|jgi:hypothetical protein